MVQRRSVRRRQTSLIRAILNAQRAQETGYSVLEALPDQAALLDGRGEIVRTNQAWKDFAVENGGDPDELDEGVGYLEVCEPTEEDPDLVTVRDMLLEVIAGKRARFSYEYPCHSPTERRWFLMRAGHLAPAGALVTHTNITERKLAELNAEALANQDPLTRTLNRRGFSRRLHGELARARRHSGPLSAILIDCDDFKDVNSRFGHAVGDVILVEMARRFCEHLRPEDILSRIGGDEFVVLLPDTNVGQARHVADRLRLAIMTTSFVTKSEDSLKMTCSAAVAGLGEDTSGLDDILRSCKDGLRHSKANGKNQAAGDRGEPHVELSRMLAFKPRIVRQPIVSLATGERVGYELLARGEGELERPVDIFRKAIELDVLQRVDLACLYAGVACLDTLTEPVVVHINVYPSTLLSLDVDALVERIAQRAQRQRVCLELCEQEIIGDPIYLRDKVAAIRSAGFTLAIDDVGFGRTSLENLIVLEPEIIKIDRRLIHQVAADLGKARQLARVVRMGLALDASIVVEGVESEADAAVCASLGVPLGQGYLWGRPEAF